METAVQTWQRMMQATSTGLVRNFTATIAMDTYLVLNDLFDEDVLEAYTNYNLARPVPEAHRKYFNAARGGHHGDYRAGMGAKIANAADALRRFPGTKRAVITIPNTSLPHHSVDATAKCMREMHLYLDGRTLNATVLMRAQAAQIFPKNIHFMGALMHEVARQVGDDVAVGQLFYVATTLVQERAD